MNTPDLHEAEYYEILDYDTQNVRCHLCPHECLLESGDKGVCLARKNIEGILYSLNYGFTEMKIDLIEKQNVYHFFPNSRAQTFATYNCNLDCSFCPVPERAHFDPEKILNKRFSPDQAVMFAVASGSRVISFGESEPLISYEWIRDTAKIAGERGLKVLLRTNGYFKEAPVIELLPYLDAVKVNIKASNTEGYIKLCGGGNFEQVKKIIKLIYDSGKLIELSFIIHEELGNDDIAAKEIAEWIATELSVDVPLHLTRLKPAHRVMHMLPTNIDLLEKSYATVKEQGLYHVYLGNVPDHQTNNTYCPHCSEELITRTSVGTEIRRVSLQGRCNKCQGDLNIVMS
jgi:pyruvate formate lyase activating enzyme